MIMNKEDYIREGMRKLENSIHYDTLDENPSNKSYIRTG